MGAESRKERILKKCQREPELRHHKVQDQGGEEGGNAGGLGGLGAVLKLVFTFGAAVRSMTADLFFFQCVTFEMFHLRSSTFRLYGLRKYGHFGYIVNFCLDKRGPYNRNRLLLGHWVPPGCL